MPKWFATFGQGYSLRNNFVILEGDSYEAVSSQMNAEYGPKWACLYAEGAWNMQRQVEEFGLSEVPFGTPNEYSPGKSSSSSQAPAEKFDSAHTGSCTARSPLGYFCTLDSQHMGQHIAHSPDGVVCDTWYDADPAVGGGTDFGNEFDVQVLASGNQLLIHRGPVSPLNRHQAYCLAAWLIKLGRKLPGNLLFSEVVKQVEKSNV